jgi:hypothetical protein
MNEQTNHNYSSTLPIASGDKYWAQDMVRDHQYLRNVGGALFEQFLGNEAHVFEVDIIKGQDNQHVNINTASGLVKMQISVPDDSNGWTVPQEVKVENIYVLVKCPVTLGFALGTLAGTIRISYDEAIVANRTRAYTGGDYAYVLSDGATIVANDSDPTEYELVVAIYEQDPQDGLVITMAEPYRNKIYRLLNSIDARITNNETQLVLNLNTINSRLESNELTLTDHEGRITTMEGLLPAEIPPPVLNMPGGIFFARLTTFDWFQVDQDYIESSGSRIGMLGSLHLHSGTTVSYNGNANARGKFTITPPAGYSQGLIITYVSVRTAPTISGSGNIYTSRLMINMSPLLEAVDYQQMNAGASRMSGTHVVPYFQYDQTMTFDQEPVPLVENYIMEVLVDSTDRPVSYWSNGANVFFTCHWFS